jgi:hypothetical protein
MTSLVRATAVFATLAAFGAPLAAHAQSNDAQLTRAQVRADLVRVEQAGYDPHKVSPHYPADIQAAESRLHPESADAAESDYGTAGSGSTASGRRTLTGAPVNVFAHH